MKELLEQVISDVGYWCWWTQSDDILQVEFGATQLNVSKGTVTEPPSHIIAIRFINPYFIAFIQKDELDAECPENWMELLHRDKIEPFNLSSDDFTLSDTDQFRRIMSQSSERSLRLGDMDFEASLNHNNAFIAFWAGNVGLALTADQMAICSHEGVLSKDIVDSMNKDFWSYWERYWIAKDSDSPLPEDYVCEIIIPAE